MIFGNLIYDDSYTIHESDYNSYDEYINENAIVNTIEDSIEKLKHKNKEDITDKEINDIASSIEKVQNKKIKIKLSAKFISLLLIILSLIKDAFLLTSPLHIFNIANMIVYFCTTISAEKDASLGVERIVKQIDKVIDKYTKEKDDAKIYHDNNSKKIIDNCDKVISICERAKTNILKNKYQANENITKGINKKLI